jgi:hypothetical protein
MMTCRLLLEPVGDVFSSEEFFELPEQEQQR